MGLKFFGAKISYENWAFKMLMKLTLVGEIERHTFRQTLRSGYFSVGEHFFDEIDPKAHVTRDIFAHNIAIKRYCEIWDIDFNAQPR